MELLKLGALELFDLINFVILTLSDTEKRVCGKPVFKTRLFAKYWQPSFLSDIFLSCIIHSPHPILDYFIAEGLPFLLI